MIRLIGIFLLAVGLSACSEPDQSLSVSSAKTDGKPWQGAQNSFVASGWQPGDKARWETQIHNRAQTQNEYLKVH
ncbi:MAG: hypothetical protein A3K04_02130 [Gallionellales bacterium RBG_16_56_9]|nr:MAG: hypothetical protein A3K04_02130 [Gallionellales bacterium RBG_16_56_9]